jgi:DNA-binding NarL/FixJ family response regulator
LTDRFVFAKIALFEVLADPAHERLSAARPQCSRASPSKPFSIYVAGQHAELGSKGSALVDLLQMSDENDAARLRENRAESPYRILLADAHSVVRHGLKASLISLRGVEICGEATTGLEAFNLAKIAMPDLVILDLSLPGMNGLEVARAIRRALARTAVLVVTMHASEDIARMALRSGAHGIVTKSDPISELIAAVQSVREHRLYVTSQLATQLQDELQPTKAQCAVDHFPLYEPELTREEITAVLARAEDKIHNEIAAMLHPALNTRANSTLAGDAI